MLVSATGHITWTSSLVASASTTGTQLPPKSSVRSLRHPCQSTFVLASQAKPFINHFKPLPGRTASVLACGIARSIRYCRSCHVPGFNNQTHRKSILYLAGTLRQLLSSLHGPSFYLSYSDNQNAPCRALRKGDTPLLRSRSIQSGDLTYLRVPSG